VWQCEDLSVLRWRDASESRVKLKMFTSGEFIIESIKLRTVAQLTLYVIHITQYTTHTHTHTHTHTSNMLDGVDEEMTTEYFDIRQQNFTELIAHLCTR